MVASCDANVPIGIERWVSFNWAERFEPAMIPVTAGKKRPTNALQNQIRYYPTVLPKIYDFVTKIVKKEKGKHLLKSS